MRLRSWVVSMTALLTATTAMAGTGYPPRTGGSYNSPRWYGYYGNNNSFDSYVSENFEHTNITEIWATYNNDPTRMKQLSDATQAIFDNLQVASEYGEKAMVDVGAFVFVTTADPLCYQNNPNAVADFKTLVDALVNAKYLVPNAPQFGAVSSFYVADEPDRNCLGDTSDGAANPALVNAISTIRLNEDTTNFPLATIVTYDDYSNMKAGLGLFDWVGLDDYHSSGVTGYLEDFPFFEANVKLFDEVGGTPQYFILVPLVSNIGSSFSPPYSDGAPNIQTQFLTDNSVIGVMPFEWNYIDAQGVSQGMVGTSWADSYIALGELIKSLSSPAETTVVVDYLTTQ